MTRILFVSLVVLVSLGSACFEAKLPSADDAGSELARDASVDTLDVETTPSNGSLDASSGMFDAAIVDAMPDGAGSAVEGGSEGSVPGVQHAACLAPLPDALPAEPNISPELVANYDAWRALPCLEGEPHLRCNSETHCTTLAERCVMLADGKDGFCTKSLDTTVGQGPWVASPTKHCGSSVTESEKRAACCAGLFDCDPERKKLPGEDCLNHADCEAGLVCKAAAWGYGLCVCPDVELEALQIDDCSFRDPPPDWGTPATPRDVGSCVAARAAGWVEEVVFAGDIGSFAVTAREDELHVLFSDAVTTTISSRVAGKWTTKPFAELGASSVALVTDAAGTVRAALCARNDLYALPDATDHSALEKVDDGCIELGMAIDATGNTVVSYQDLAVGTKLARGKPGVWAFSVVGEDTLWSTPPQVAVDADDRVHVIYNAVTHAQIEAGQTELFELGLSFPPDLTASFLRTPVVVWSGTLGTSIFLAALDTGAPQAEEIWSLMDPTVLDGDTEPRVAFDAMGSPAIAHRSPRGISLLTRKDRVWTSTVLVRELPQYGLMDLVFDNSGEPHIVYAAQFTDRFSTELRHLRRGVCP